MIGSVRDHLSGQFQLIETTRVQSIPIDRLQNHLTGQHQLLESTRHQLLKRIQLLDIARTIPIDKQLRDSAVGVVV